MTIAYWCVLVAALMPYVAASVAKAAAGERYDNRNPRAWLLQQQGLSARANAAQANGFEAFPFFAAAVIVAHLTQAPQERIDALAVMFVLARLAYAVFYLADWHWARSIAWTIGIVATITLFVSGA